MSSAANIPTRSVSGFYIDFLICNKHLQNQHASHRKEDLTLRFYGCKALFYMRVCELEKSLKTFHNGPNSNQSLVEGAVLISQWGQVEKKKMVKLEEVKASLDKIAQRVIKVIADKHRNLKILERNESDEVIVIANGNPELEKKVLVCINDVLYGEMGFGGNVEDYYNYDNSFIDKVVETFQFINYYVWLLWLYFMDRIKIFINEVVWVSMN